MTTPILLRVSPSTLSTFARCKLKAFLRASGFNGVITREEEGNNAPLESGKAIHRALWVKLSGKDDETALKELDSYREFADAVVPVDDRCSYMNIKRVMTAYFNQRSLDGLLFMAMFPEREFKVELGNSEAGGRAYRIFLIGRFDVAIVRMVSNGALWIMEHKSTGKRLVGKGGDDWFRQWRTDAQVSALVYAARKLGIDVTGLLLNAIGVHKLPTSTKRCPEHQMAYNECWEAHFQARMQPEQRDAEQVENWRVNALGLAVKLGRMLEDGKDDPLEYAKGVEQQGLFNGSCAYCEFNHFCASGNRTNAQWLTRDTNPEGVTRSGLFTERESQNGQEV